MLRAIETASTPAMQAMATVPDIEKPLLRGEETNRGPEQGDRVAHHQQNPNLGGAQLPVGKLEAPSV